MTALAAEWPPRASDLFENSFMLLNHGTTWVGDALFISLRVLRRKSDRSLEAGRNTLSETSDRAEGNEEWHFYSKNKGFGVRIAERRLTSGT